MELASHRGPARSAYATRDLTQGSIPRNLAFLGWPQMVSGAVDAIDQLADLFWAGFLGPRAIATVGVAQSWIQVFNTGRMGLDTAARAMVARAVGARDLPQANSIARQCLLFNVLVSVVVMGTGILLSDLLLRVLGVAESLVEEGTTYQRVRFAGSFCFSLHMVSGSLLAAGGDTLTPMKARVATRATHLALSPVLMFGWLGLPAFGISGAAAANAISASLGAVMNLYALHRGSSRLQLTLAGPGLDWAVIRRQVQIGAPASITSAERSLAQVVLVGLAAPFGPTGLAVYAVTQRIQMLGGFGSQGLAQAAGVIVGQNLGARQPERARRTVWWAMGIVLGIQTVICGLVFAFPEAVAFAFSRDPAVIELAAVWLRIEVIGFILFSTANVLVLAFNTAGDTMIPMLAGLGSLWGVQQPAAIALTGAGHSWRPLGLPIGLPDSLNLGVLGIAWAIVIAAIARFLALFLYFLWGPWWKKEVLVRPRATALTDEAETAPSLPSRLTSG